MINPEAVQWLEEQFEEQWETHRGESPLGLHRVVEPSVAAEGVRASGMRNLLLREFLQARMGRRNA